jgi:sugar O-acyltransferase (sialic acid O-acetyltransferase NeuD family)
MSPTGSECWLVYACRTSYTAEIAEIVWRRSERLALLVDNLEPGSGGVMPDGLGDVPLMRPGEIDDAQCALSVVIPLLTPGYRYSVSAEARGFGLSRFPALIDPTAIIGRTVTLGEGTVVNAGSVIGARTTIGHFVQLNRSGSIGHDNVVEDFATLGPGSVLAGHVRVGTGAFIGAGAVCAPEVTIGANAVVGAGAVVIDDVPTGAVAVGNPAKVLREGNGYAGVTVPVAP